jgi:hypothetical protein
VEAEQTLNQESKTPMRNPAADLGPFRLASMLCWLAVLPYGTASAQRLAVWDAVARYLRQDELPSSCYTFSACPPPPPATILNIPTLHSLIEAEAGWASTLGPRGIVRAVCFLPLAEACLLDGEGTVAEVGAPVLIAADTIGVWVRITRFFGREECASRKSIRAIKTSRWLMDRRGKSWHRAGEDSVSTTTIDC